mmetsp:Transcript_61983/g.202173  ORF Transcript_61983/g.202173 Transcript_61983/m.202173 type:complete len:108 (+) Transcript_61983:80-403(+)
MSRAISAEELAGHRAENDCWIAIHGDVYDVSSFVGEHPGGKHLLMDVAGYDGTAAFQTIHQKEIIDQKLPPGSKKGTISPSEQEKAKPPVKPNVSCLDWLKRVLPCF